MLWRLCAGQWLEWLNEQRTALQQDSSPDAVLALISLYDRAINEILCAFIGLQPKMTTESLDIQLYPSVCPTLSMLCNLSMRQEVGLCRHPKAKSQKKTIKRVENLMKRHKRSGLKTLLETCCLLPFRRPLAIL